MEWSYAVGDDVRGPFSEAQIVQKIESGEIRRGTSVWNSELPGWIEAGASTLASHFSVRPLATPPIPQPMAKVLPPFLPPSLELRRPERSMNSALSAALLSLTALLVASDLGDRVPSTVEEQYMIIPVALSLPPFAVLASFWCHGAWSGDERARQYKTRPDPQQLLISAMWALASFVAVFVFLSGGEGDAAAEVSKTYERDLRAARFVVPPFVAGITFVGALLLGRLASRKRIEIPLTVSAGLLTAWLYWHLLRIGAVSMEVVVCAVVIGVAPALIAKKKGREFGLWWVYGALCFIVALAHSLLMKPDIQAIEREGLSEGKKKCPSCAELIKVDATVCRYCGRDAYSIPIQRL